MGKGSIPRPFSVTQQEYSQRWDAIFGRDIKDEKTPVDGSKAEEKPSPPQPQPGQPEPPGVS